MDMNPLKLTLERLESCDEPSRRLSGGDHAVVRSGLFDYDSVAKVTCYSNCWYQRACSFNAYVKDGIVLRAEQTGVYPAPNNPSVPDRNPRSCQKGIAYAHRMYDPGRLKYPLKRVGERGEGRWKRVSWDDALTEIADAMIEVLAADGPQGIFFTGGTQGVNLSTEDTSCQAVATALGIPLPAVTVETGDEHQGAWDTLGKIIFSDSADNWFHADVILVWGGNPAYTNIPNFHYITEARYNGTRVVTISPDYNASAIRGDLWVPVNIGADAALALSIAHVILRERAYNEQFVREQTDLPMLVRTDTRRFLREKDLKRGGKDDVFYVWDLQAGRLAEAPRKSLELNSLAPALEGEYEVETLAGPVKVRPVFELLREKTEEYAPERASRITGVSPRVVEGLAREIARARGVVNITTANWGKFYHGDLTERAVILVFALCGHMGRKGATFSAFPMLALDTSLGNLAQRGDQVLLSAASADPRFAQWRLDGYTDEMILHEYVKEAYQKGAIGATSLLFYFHGGLLGLSEKHGSRDPYLKRPLRAYVDEAFEKGWQHAVPGRDRPPRILFSMGGNWVRRVRGTEEVIRTLLPKLRLSVCIDFRMNSTALYSDFVLPAAGWYEKCFILILEQIQNPYVHLLDRAAEPLYESKGEWEIWCLLAKKIEERAKGKGIRSFTDAAGQERRLDDLYGKVTFNGLYTPEDDEALTRDTFLNALNAEKMDWEEFRKKGVAAYTGVGSNSRSIGNACDIQPGEPVVPLTVHTEKKQPYPTLTRRIQFYIDQDLFLELGEELPTWKADPSAGGDYPLRLTGGHARWSIHTSHVDNTLLLQLQRGEPLMLMNTGDAESRGIGDGERVEVRNNVASFGIQAVVSPAVRPGQVIIYHAWENFQFYEWRHFKSVMPAPLNPVELAGGYFHIQSNPVACYPGPADRDTRVEVTKAA
jgi:DMSO reductase family type II enzyme molybdopterin subunit